MARSTIVSSWRIVRFPSTSVAGLAIPVEAKEFLAETGLPAWAASFSFSLDNPIESVAEKHGLDDEDLEEDAALLARLPVIGRHDGDPVCMDERGRVLVVNHERGFREAALVSSSLPQLLECLSVFEAYQEATRSLAPLPDDRDAWRRALANAASQLQAADRDAYRGYWHETLAQALTPLAFDMAHLTLGSVLAEVIAPPGRAETPDTDTL